VGTLKVAGEVAGSANDQNSEPIGSVAPEPVLLDVDVSAPWDVKAVFQGGMFFLMLLGACYLAAEILLPIVLAFVLMLVLQPAMRLLERWHLPRGVAALALILMLFGTFAGLGTALSGPATDWAQKLPEGIPKLQERLSFLSTPIAAFQKFASQAEGLAAGAEGKTVSVKVEGTGLSDRLINGTRNVVSGLLETVLVLFFPVNFGRYLLAPPRGDPASVQKPSVRRSISQTRLRAISQLTC